MNNIVPDEAVVKFKCSFCNNYLSYFPISLSKGDQNVCGRCSIPQGTVTYHNKVFEEIAQYVRFPCRYKEQGCYKQLLPEEVPSHEKDCFFKVVKCPGKEFTNCCWEGARNTMLYHSQDAHRDMYLKNKTFELNANDSNFMRRFLEYDGTLFIFSIYHDLLDMDNQPQMVFFMVYHVEDEMTNLENYSYQIVLRKGKTNVGVESVTTTFSEKAWSKIALDSLTVGERVAASPIAGSIVFERSFDDVTGKELNKKFLSLLECSLCKDYVLPPVKCESGEIRCNNCATDKCKPNTNLDEIAKMLDYPCRYKRNGCDVVLKSEKMIKHLTICSFGLVKCVLCDRWFSLKKHFEDHVITTHCDMIVRNNQIISLELNESLFHGVICCGGHVFLLVYHKVETSPDSLSDYNWNVYDMMNSVEEVFQYELEVMNPEYKNVRLLMQEKCVGINNLAFKSCNFINVPKLLKMKDKITFKVKIF